MKIMAVFLVHRTIAEADGSLPSKPLHAEVDVAYHHGREFVEAQVADR